MDEGVPTLKKRGVYMPGHQEVLDPEEREAIYGSASGGQNVSR